MAISTTTRTRRLEMRLSAGICKIGPFYATFFILLTAMNSTLVTAPRHSRRMTHLCSDRVTHTKNRPCPWARSEQAISSTPKACKVFGSAGPSRQLPVCTGPAREQYTTQLSVVVGHFWRAKYGHFSRVPKAQLVFKAEAEK